MRCIHGCSWALHVLVAFHALILFLRHFYTVKDVSIVTMEHDESVALEEEAAHLQRLLSLMLDANTGIEFEKAKDSYVFQGKLPKLPFVALLSFSLIFSF
jgi:hypothetical protein